MVSNENTLPGALNYGIKSADFNEIIPFIHDHSQLFSFSEENQNFISALYLSVGKSAHKDFLEPWFRQWINPLVYNGSLTELKDHILQGDTEHLKVLLSNPKIFSSNSSYLDFSIEELFKFSLENKAAECSELMLKYGVYVPLSEQEIQSLPYNIKLIVRAYFDKRKAFGRTLPSVIQAAACIGNIPSVKAFIEEYPEWNGFTGSADYNLVDLALLAEKPEMVALLMMKGGKATDTYLKKHKKPEEVINAIKAKESEENFKKDIIIPVTPSERPPFKARPNLLGVFGKNSLGEMGTVTSINPPMLPTEELGENPQTTKASSPDTPSSKPEAEGGFVFGKDPFGDEGENEPGDSQEPSIEEPAETPETPDTPPFEIPPIKPEIDTVSGDDPFGDEGENEPGDSQEPSIEEPAETPETPDTPPFEIPPIKPEIDTVSGDDPFGEEGGIITPINSPVLSFEKAVDEMPLSQEAKDLLLAWRKGRDSDEKLEKEFGSILVKRSRLLFDILEEYFNK